MLTEINVGIIVLLNVWREIKCILIQLYNMKSKTTFYKTLQDLHYPCFKYDGQIKLRHLLGNLNIALYLSPPLFDLTGMNVKLLTGMLIKPLFKCIGIAQKVSLLILYHFYLVLIGLLIFMSILVQANSESFVVKTLDRKTLWEMQTPQVVSLSLLEFFLQLQRPLNNFVWHR